MYGNKFEKSNIVDRALKVYRELYYLLVNGQETIKIFMINYDKSGQMLTIQLYILINKKINDL